MNTIGSLFIATIVAILVSSTILSGGINISEAKKSSLEELRAQQQERQQQLQQQQQQQQNGQNLQTQAVTTSATSGGASNIADNSVTSPKIKDGEVKTADLADQSVTTQKIKAGSIVPKVRFARGEVVTVAPHEFGIANAFCNAGEVVTGAGIGFSGAEIRSENPIPESQSGTGVQGWQLQVFNPRDIGVNIGTTAVCLSLEP